MASPTATSFLFSLTSGSPTLPSIPLPTTIKGILALFKKYSSTSQSTPADTERVIKTMEKVSTAQEL